MIQQNMKNMVPKVIIVEGCQQTTTWDINANKLKKTQRIMYYYLKIELFASLFACFAY